MRLTLPIVFWNMMRGVRWTVFNGDQRMKMKMKMKMKMLWTKTEERCKVELVGAQTSEVGGLKGPRCFFGLDFHVLCFIYFTLLYLSTLIVYFTCFLLVCLLFMPSVMASNVSIFFTHAYSR